MRAASVVVAAAPARLGVGGVGGVGDVLCFNISHLTGVVVLPQHSPSQALTGALVSPVSVGAGVLAGAVPVVQQALVLVRAERPLGCNSADIYNIGCKPGTTSETTSILGHYNYGCKSQEFTLLSVYCSNLQ